jgi:hypothetical protein
LYVVKKESLFGEQLVAVPRSWEWGALYPT